MSVKKGRSLEELGDALGVSSERVVIAKMKAKLKKRILQEVVAKELTAVELAGKSGLARSTVSGILNGSLQSVSLERLIRLAAAAELTVDLNIKAAA